MDKDKCCGNRFHRGGGQVRPILRLRMAVAAVGIALMWSGQISAVRAQDVHTQKATAVVASDKLESAKTYFDRARKLGYPAVGQTQPYVLQGTFTTRASSGKIDSGSYTDTWVGDTQWRREATLGTSRFIRSRDGKKWYRVEDGPDAAVLQFVLTAMEPIPSTARLNESKWAVERGDGEHAGTVRVSWGRENAGGMHGAEMREAFWFDGEGRLVAAHLNGLELKWSQFEDFSGVRVARQIDVSVAGQVGMQIRVTGVEAAAGVDRGMFKIKGNDWLNRDGTEVR